MYGSTQLCGFMAYTDAISGGTGAGPGADYCTASTVLLLHCDGIDNGVVVTDETGKTVNITGNTRTKTSTVKLGTASVFMDTDGDGIYADDFVNGDFDFLNDVFWLECFVYPAEPTVMISFISVCFMFAITPSYTLRVSAYKNFSWYNYETATPVVSNDRFYHVAVCRTDTGNVKMFVDGVVVFDYGGPFPDDWDTSNGRLFINCQDVDGGGSQQIYLDEYRLIKGCCPHDTDFTPPVAPYSYP